MFKDALYMVLFQSSTLPDRSSVERVNYKESAARLSWLSILPGSGVWNSSCKFAWTLRKKEVFKETEII